MKKAFSARHVITGARWPAKAATGLIGTSQTYRRAPSLRDSKFAQSRSCPAERRDPYSDGVETFRHNDAGGYRSSSFRRTTRI